MKKSSIFRTIIKNLAVKYDLPERKILRIVLSHFRHVKKAISQPIPAEIKLDYFGKFIYYCKQADKLKANDKSN